MVVQEFRVDFSSHNEKRSTFKTYTEYGVRCRGVASNLNRAKKVKRISLVLFIAETLFWTIKSSVPTGHEFVKRLLSSVNSVVETKRRKKKT